MRVLGQTDQNLSENVEISGFKSIKSERFDAFKMKNTDKRKIKRVLPLIDCRQDLFYSLNIDCPSQIVGKKAESELRCSLFYPSTEKKISSVIPFNCSERLILNLKKIFFQSFAK